VERFVSLAPHGSHISYNGAGYSIRSLGHDLEFSRAHRLDRKPGRQPAPRDLGKHAASWHTVADVDSAETMATAREVKREMKAKH
jgi:hypothetical protein